MRHLYALIIGTGLCVPSLALADAPAQAQRPIAAATSQSVAQHQTTARQQAASSDRAWSSVTSAASLPNTIDGIAAAWRAGRSTSGIQSS